MSILPFAASLVMLLGAPGIEIIIPDIPFDLDYKYENKIDYIYAEPRKPSQGDQTKLKIKVSFSSNLTRVATLSFGIKTDTYPEERAVMDFLIEAKSKTIEYSYTQTHSTVFNERVVFCFSLYSQYGSDRVEFVSLKQDYKQIKVKNSNETFSTIQNVNVYRPSLGVLYESERISVSNAYQDVYLNQDNSISLNPFSFSYSSNSSIIPDFNNVRLYIQTHDNHFSSFGENLFDIYRVIPLTIKTGKLQGAYTFSSPNQMYVNPITLEMSLTQQSGYIKTDRIYFPKSCKEDEVFTLTFQMDDVGANDLDFAYTFKVHTPIKKYGNCNDSMYCLSTEETTPNLNHGVIIRSK